MTAGDIKCWGLSEDGRLGNNWSQRSATPRDVVKLVAKAPPTPDPFAPTATNTVTQTPTGTPTPTNTPTATRTPTPTPTPTVTPVPVGPRMSLAAHGSSVDCNGDGVPDTEPTNGTGELLKCFALYDPAQPTANEFQVTINADIEFEIAGFGAEVFFGGLSYSESACTDEIVMPATALPLCYTGASYGERQLGGMTGLFMPLPAANPGGVPVTLATLSVHCPGPGQFEVWLTANVPEKGSAFGATYVGAPSGDLIEVAVVTRRWLDDRQLALADALDVSCVDSLPGS